MMDRFQWKTALSTRPSLEAAVKEVTEAIKHDFSQQPHLGFVFISSAYASEYARLIPLLLEQISLPVLIGCGGGGIIGMNQEQQPIEIEDDVALSLTVAYLPGVEIHTFQITEEDIPDLDSSPETWIELIGVDAHKKPDFILLSDPFSRKINDLLAGLDYAYPESVKVGGLASNAMPGIPSGLFYHCLYHEENNGLLRQGTIGIALSGNLRLETIVAQGCRPIGQPYRVVEKERNIILGLAECEQMNAQAQSPMSILRNVIEELSPEDRALAEHSLFVGIATDEFKLKLEAGDFLIRNLLGIEPNKGAIAIGDRVRVGQRIQFHLRDAKTSAEDLKLLLQSYLAKRGDGDTIGALMFSCLGRGKRLYKQPNFDSQMFANYLPNIPLAGFFCNGEIGPINGQTFLHGYTSAFGIIRQI
ncbi:MAG: hypothetical protein D6756_08945 [Cyanobacteria bacterium J083]|nr:MAG: hypothetical protein D6756_08945 [Cyanobacteria bacterium J083]